MDGFSDHIAVLHNALAHDKNHESCLHLRKLCWGRGSTSVVHEGCLNLCILEHIPNVINGNFRLILQILVYARVAKLLILGFCFLYIISNLFRHTGAKTMYFQRSSNLVTGWLRGSSKLTLEDSLLVKEMIVSSTRILTLLGEYRCPLINSVFFRALIVGIIIEFSSLFMFLCQLESADIVCIVELCSKTETKLIENW